MVTFSDLKMYPSNIDLLSANNYYPFGMLEPERNWAASKDYRYGYNSQEIDNEIAGVKGAHLTFDYRTEDTRICRFLSLDPLRQSFPWNSPYAFAENRPIDGIDLEGREWDQTIDDQGKVNITCNAKFENNSGINFSEKQIKDYQNSISEQFNCTLQLSSGGTISGSITFNEISNQNQMVPILKFGPKSDFCGSQSINQVVIDLFKEDGTIKSPFESSLDGVHEFLHTTRVSHPFEWTQGEDLKLLFSGFDENQKANYVSTPTTDKNILYNIMNYPTTSINGVTIKNIGQEQIQTLLTNSQISIMVNNINMQKQGYGILPKYYDSDSQNIKYYKYKTFYENYWKNIPGEKIEKESK